MTKKDRGVLQSSTNAAPSDTFENRSPPHFEVSQPTATHYDIKIALAVLLT
jgi:hypothetical protein